MIDWLAQRAAVTPHATALIYEQQSWTYAQLDAHVQNQASALLFNGVQPGDHVAMLLPNTPDAVSLVHAAARIGAVLTPLNTRLTAHELIWQLEHTRPVVLIYDEESALRAAEVSTAVPAMIDPERLNFPTPLPTALPDFDADRTQAILFTSGTTGRPKGAVLTFSNHFWSATASSYRLGIHTDDRWLSCLPLYHVGGMAVVFRSCLYGIAIILHRRFEMDAFVASLHFDRATITSLVPTMLHRLLQSHGEQLASLALRTVLLGGAAATSELIEAAGAASIPVATTYGLTEASSQVTTQRPADTQFKPGSVGKPLMYTSLRVIDEDGAALPAGEIGEIAVRGPMVMREYYHNPEATSETIREGELHTGDMGRLDGDGDLWVVQRRSDIIVSGGENIYPAEVEQILRSHPDVEDVCVVGVANSLWGESVAALVATASEELNASVLESFSRQHLAGYKTPRRFKFTRALPETASGKIERRRVAELMSTTD